MILVCGDAMIDRYYFCDVTRISPEGPVPVALVQRTEDREGGAANVANNVKAMGAASLSCFSPSAECVTKIRIIGRSQQLVRVDFDPPQEPLDAEDFSAQLRLAKYVIFSDYGKGSLANIQGLILKAKAAGKTVLVDPKGYNYKRYAGADVVKPNVDEMRELVGGWATEDELLAKARDLLRRAEIQAILLTRAAKGMTLFTMQGHTQIPAVAQEVYDVSGAGDTAIAAFAVALSRGHGFHIAASYANKAAGIVVGRFGTSVATEKEVFG